MDPANATADQSLTLIWLLFDQFIAAVRHRGLSLVRPDAVYTLTIKRAPAIPGKPADSQILLRRKTAYKIVNLDARENAPLSRTVRAGFNGLSTVTLDNGEQFPRFIALHVDREPKRIENRSGPIAHDVLLEIKPIDVTIESEELYNCDDQGYYTQYSPLLGLTVEIVNNLSDRISIAEVQLSDSTALSPSTLPEEDGTWRDGAWRYTGALLPGQGFWVTWKTRPAGSPAKSVDGNLV